MHEAFNFLAVIFLICLVFQQSNKILGSEFGINANTQIFSIIFSAQVSNVCGETLVKQNSDIETGNSVLIPLQQNFKLVWICRLPW